MCAIGKWKLGVPPQNSAAALAQANKWKVEARRAAAADVVTIVTPTYRPKQRGRFGAAPDLTPDELQRRCDAADALWRELMRRVTEEDKEP